MCLPNTQHKSCLNLEWLSSFWAVPLRQQGLMSDWADSLSAATIEKHNLHVRVLMMLDAAISLTEHWGTERSPIPEGEACKGIKAGFVNGKVTFLSAVTIWHWVNVKLDYFA